MYLLLTFLLVNSRWMSIAARYKTVKIEINSKPTYTTRHESLTFFSWICISYNRVRECCLLKMFDTFYTIKTYNTNSIECVRLLFRPTYLAKLGDVTNLELDTRRNQIVNYVVNSNRYCQDLCEYIYMSFAKALKVCITISYWKKRKHVSENRNWN